MSNEFHILHKKGGNGTSLTFKSPTNEPGPDWVVGNNSTYILSGSVTGQNRYGGEKSWVAGDGGWPGIYPGTYHVVFKEPNTEYVCITPKDTSRFFHRETVTLTKSVPLLIEKGIERKTIVPLNNHVEVDGEFAKKCRPFEIKKDVTVTCNEDNTIIVILTDITKEQALEEANEYVAAGGIIP